MSEEISNERAERVVLLARVNQARIERGYLAWGVTFSKEPPTERTPESDAIGKEMGFNFETNEFDDRSSGNG